MNILSFDTSTDFISFAVTIKGKVVYKYSRRKKYGASSLIVHIKSTMDKLGISLNAFDAFCVGAGPGSFTGLRISFSIIKGFCAALDKPAISISSFENCASQLKDKYKHVAVIADAKRNLIYGIPFKVKSGKIIREKKEALYHPDDFIKEYKDYVFCAYDSFLREKILVMNNSLNFYSKDIWPEAGNLALLAKDYYLEKKFTPLEKLEPLYVYPKDCQVRKMGHRA